MRRGWGCGFLASGTVQDVPQDQKWNNSDLWGRSTGAHRRLLVGDNQGVGREGPEEAGDGEHHMGRGRRANNDNSDEDTINDQ